MLTTTDTSPKAQAQALAAIVTQELASRVGDSHPHWTAKENRMISWLYSKATVTATPGKVSVDGPAGYTARKFGYVLYGALEQAMNTLESTPWAVPFEGPGSATGETTETGGSLTW